MSSNNVVLIGSSQEKLSFLVTFLVITVIIQSSPTIISGNYVRHQHWVDRMRSIALENQSHHNFPVLPINHSRLRGQSPVMIALEQLISFRVLSNTYFLCSSYVLSKYFWFSLFYIMYIFTWLRKYCFWRVLCSMTSISIPMYAHFAQNVQHSRVLHEKPMGLAGLLRHWCILQVLICLFKFQRFFLIFDLWFPGEMLCLGTFGNCLRTVFSEYARGTVSIPEGVQTVNILTKYSLIVC